MNNLSKTIVKDIKRKNLKPIPREFFIVISLIFWVLFALLIFTSALFLSIVIKVLHYGDFNMGIEMIKMSIYIFWELLGWLWLVMGILFLTSAYFIYRNTKYGYRMNVKSYITSYMVVILILGILISFTELNKNLIRFIYSVSGKSIEERKMHIWNNPNIGILSGYVMKDSDVYKIKDEKGTIWNLNTQYVDDFDLTVLNNLKNVVVFGYKMNNTYFVACKIRPLMSSSINSQVKASYNKEHKSKMKLYAEILKNETKNNSLRINTCEW